MRPLRRQCRFFSVRPFEIVIAGQEVAAGLARIAILIVVTQVIRSVLQLGRNFGADLLGQRLERDIREELYLSLLGKSMTFHNLQPVGDTMARATNDVREIGLMFNPGLNLVIGSANFILLPLIVAPSIYPTLILIPMLFTILYAVAIWAIPARATTGDRGCAEDVRRHERSFV